MSHPTICRRARNPMPWGVLVKGDAKRCEPAGEGDTTLGVLKRPIGGASGCVKGEEVTIQTDGPILALIGGESTAVILRNGQVTHGR